MATQTKKQWLADKKLAREMGNMAIATKMLVDTIDKSTKPWWQSKIVWVAAVMLGIQIYFGVKSGLDTETIVGAVFAAAFAALRLVTTKTLTSRAKKEGK